MIRMSDTEQIDEKPSEELPVKEEPKIDETQLPNMETPSKLGKKGLRKSTPMTPERLEILRLARIKALEVRKANSIANGKAAEREVKKQKAVENTKRYEDNYNKKVEDEVNRRMMSMSMDDKMSKIDELVERKMAEAMAKKKKTKKVIQEEESSGSEEEIVVRKRRPKKVIYEEPEPEPQSRYSLPQEQHTPQFQRPPMSSYFQNAFDSTLMRNRMIPRM